MQQVVSTHLLRQDVEREPQEFILERNTVTGEFKLLE